MLNAVGTIGFEGRYDYGAIGSVVNLAARLCGEARAGQILISQRVHADVEELIEAERIGDLTLKGFHQPVAAFNAVGLKDGGTSDERAAGDKAAFVNRTSTGQLPS